MKKLLLTTLAAAAIATAAHAQNITITAVHGRALQITSATNATSNVTFRYEWTRNGTPIAGATEAFYTVPANLANGLNQVFRRRAILTSQCTGSNMAETNTVTVNFKCGNGLGTVVTNTSAETDLCWADRNVGAVGTFTATAHEYSAFFQWDRFSPWPATGAGTPSGWNPATDPVQQAATGWSNNGQGPCPAGWRVPTVAEFNTIRAASGLGLAWRTANSGYGNAVNGAFVGHRAASCGFLASQNMFGCIFLPAGGHRSPNGTLTTTPSWVQGSLGWYWASTQSTAANGNTLHIGSGGDTNHPLDKLSGLNVRCVFVP